MLAATSDALQGALTLLFYADGLAGRKYENKIREQNFFPTENAAERF